MIWKDETSYSQDDNVRIPRVWTLYAGDLRITVHRVCGADENVWFLSCHVLGISQTELISIPLKTAKLEAVAIIKETLRGYLKDVEGIK